MRQVQVHPPIMPALRVSRFPRRLALSLLLFATGLAILQLSVGTILAFENTGSSGALIERTATLLPGGKVLAAGGALRSICCQTVPWVDLYDPATGSWTATADMAAAREQHTATLLPNGKVLVVGGASSTTAASDQRLASAELYDPASGTWAATGSLATARFLHTATLLPNGKVLVAGGVIGVNNNSGAIASVELYDPATGTWTATGSMATARAYHTATLLGNGKVLVAGGTDKPYVGAPNTTYFANAELYDPATGIWTSTGLLNDARGGHTATLLDNGKLLVAGGYNGVYLASAELYDPATGSWTATGLLSLAREGHTATLLNNGKVFVAGGFDGNGGYPGVFLTNAQLYDPATGSWADTYGTLNQGRAGHTATRLLDGKVLIANGRKDNSGQIGSYLQSCELYDPSAMPTPTPTATATATPTATPTPTPTSTPTPTPATSLNISTRSRVQTGDNVMIAGFIVTGNASKKVIIRALGPSLTKSGLSGVLADPVLELRGPDGSLILSNDNWRENPDQALLIQASGIPPQNDLESAIVATLPPAGYTAVVRGKSNGTGLGVVEIYDLDQSADAELANLSTRAFVETGDNVVIAGFILGGADGSPQMIVRAMGPSLAPLGVTNVLADPTLEVRDGNGALVAFNDNWQDNPAQAAQLTAAGFAPRNDLESALAIRLSPGTYTAIAAGKNGGTGVGMVEIYNLQ
jgi:N-acetylneuraminic acid mutarotase